MVVLKYNFSLIFLLIDVEQMFELECLQNFKIFGLWCVLITHIHVSFNLVGIIHVIFNMSELKLQAICETSSSQVDLHGTEF